VQPVFVFPGSDAADSVRFELKPALLKYHYQQIEKNKSPHDNRDTPSGDPLS
jgi:hypothetical protein